MKPTKSKAQERREIEQQIQDFLQGGGEVQPVAPGVSGREPGSYRLPSVSFDGPKFDRTPLLEEIKAIEARRGGVNRKPMARKGPRRILITDDFGEPLRWSWKDN